MRWWWQTRTPQAESNVDAALRDQELKVAQEKHQIKDLMAGAQSDQLKAQRQLVRAQEISHETEKVTEQIKKEEERNGLAILFRRGLSGGMP